MTQTMLETGTLKFRSGMAVMWGAHLIKHGTAVQSTVALSSGESEYCALRRSSAHARGIRAMLNDWHYGVECESHMRCDSSAASDKDWENCDMLMCASCCRQNTHSHDTFAHVQRITERCAQVQSLITRTRVAQVVCLGVSKVVCHPSVMSHMMPLVNEHFHTISLTCLPTFFSLTVLSSGIGSRTPARFRAELRIL